MQPQFQSNQSTPRGIVGFMIRTGLARDEKSARLVLGVALVALLVVAGYFFFSEDEQAWDEPYAPDTEYGGRELPTNYR